MVQIINNYYMSAETGCYTLLKEGKISNEKSSKFGQIKYDTLGYYTTLDGCLKGVLKSETRDFLSKTQKNTIEELIKFVKTQDKLLQEKLKEL